MHYQIRIVLDKKLSHKHQKQMTCAEFKKIQNEETKKTGYMDGPFHRSHNRIEKEVNYIL